MIFISPLLRRLAGMAVSCAAFYLGALAGAQTVSVATEPPLTIELYADAAKGVRLFGVLADRPPVSQKIGSGPDALALSIHLPNDVATAGRDIRLRLNLVASRVEGALSVADQKSLQACTLTISVNGQAKSYRLDDPAFLPEESGLALPQDTARWAKFDLPAGVVKAGPNQVRISFEASLPKFAGALAVAHHRAPGQGSANLGVQILVSKKSETRLLRWESGNLTDPDGLATQLEKDSPSALYGQRAVKMRPVVITIDPTRLERQAVVTGLMHWTGHSAPRIQWYDEMNRRIVPNARVPGRETIYTFPKSYDRLARIVIEEGTMQDLELRYVPATLPAGHEGTRQFIGESNQSDRTATWTASSAVDPDGVLGFAQASDSSSGSFTLELDHRKINTLFGGRIALQSDGAHPLSIRLFDATGYPLALPVTNEGTTWTVDIPAATAQAPNPWPFAVQASGSQMQSATVHYTAAPSRDELDDAGDMAPTISTPRYPARSVASPVTLRSDGFTIATPTLQAEFRTTGGLSLVALHHHLLNRDLLRHPDKSKLFDVEWEGKFYPAKVWAIDSVELDGTTGVRVRLTLAAANLSADFRISANSTSTATELTGLRWGLTLHNHAPQPQRLKASFPSLAGLVLSERESEDYYFFPYHGGVIGSVPATLQGCYGDESMWWQMLDIFSPAGGAGLSCRIDDPAGIWKTAELRKGAEVALTTPPMQGEPGNVLPAIVAPGTLWEKRADVNPGTSISWQYQQKTRESGKSWALPDAVFEAHAGDWKPAMKAYTEWSHRTWGQRPIPSKLTDVWNMTAEGWGQTPLFQNGKYRTEYIQERIDCAELMSWWEWSNVGPWGVSNDRIKEELGEAFAKTYSPYFVKDPVTGVRKYTLNRGDYVGSYNLAWGGRDALRSHIQAMQKAGQLATLYTDPITADDNTALGRTFGRRYGVKRAFAGEGTMDTTGGRNPPGYITSYGSWNMDVNNAWYQQFLAQQMASIIADTGADGIRLDEYGNRGYTCFSQEHDHLINEPGCNVWMQAVGLACRRIHAAMDAVNPASILTAEHQGNDYVGAAMDGGVTYESITGRLPVLREAPINIFRFYFPGCKLYDLDYKQVPSGDAWRFWNAVGAFSAIFPEDYHRILKENSDAFGGAAVEPLVPTLASRVYANVFSHGEKRVWVFFNARRFSYAGPLVSATAKPDHHWVDLLGGRELPVVNGRVEGQVKSRDAACFVELPRLLTATVAAEGWQIRCEPAAGDTLVLCDETGRTLEKFKAAASQTLPALPAAHMVKLFKGKYLADVAILHRR